MVQWLRGQPCSAGRPPYTLPCCPLSPAETGFLLSLLVHWPLPTVLWILSARALKRTCLARAVGELCGSSVRGYVILHLSGRELDDLGKLGELVGGRGLKSSLSVLLQVSVVGLPMWG